MLLVDYLVTRDGSASLSGHAYDYVLAGNGVYVQAENPHLAARVSIAPCHVRGLPALEPAFVLKHGRLPLDLWQHIVAVAQSWAVFGQEVLLTVRHDARLGYHLVVPRQATGPTEITYRPAPNVVLEIHSHHAYPARFSPVDDADEQRLALYGVLGRLDTAHPQVALRLGVYGYFMPVQWDQVFDGVPGGFSDAFYPGESEDDDDLSD